MKDSVEIFKILILSFSKEILVFTQENENFFFFVSSIKRGRFIGVSTFIEMLKYLT